MSHAWRLVHISEQIREELSGWPLEVKKDLGAVLTKLQKGLVVGYPDTRPMQIIAKGVFEIRLNNNKGTFRVISLIKHETGIIVFHAFQKKTQKTPYQEIETARASLKLYLRELENE